MTDIMRGDVMRDGEVIAHDVVLNTRTGDLRFGAGIPIVVQEPPVKLILNAVGSDVQFGLTWDWPPQ